eukprot:c2851_g1_i1.p1 GENE.c2851_g1_i1~~c2851_g1_i1.p1  ORF type:complete len:1626 (+),score=407.52 c2851_g1_i1:472-4878(+)
MCKKMGFNCIHLTPISKLGVSGSCYSVADQVAISSKIVSDKDAPTPREKEERVEEFTSWARKELGVLTICDVVWNHTASNSEWLSMHPESGYHPGNSPHLAKAALLDLGLRWLSNSVERGESGLPSVITSVAHVHHIFEFFRHAVLPQLRIWEFYAVDIAAAQTALRTFMQTPASQQIKRIRFKSKEERVLYLETRGLVPNEQNLPPKIDASVVAALYCPFDPSVPPTIISASTTHFEPLKRSYTEEEIATAIADLRDDLNVINVALYRSYDSDMEAAIENATSGVIYQRVSHDGPKLNNGKVTSHFRLVDPYFTLVAVPADVPLHPHSELLADSPSGLQRGFNGVTGDALGWDLWLEDQEILRSVEQGSVRRSESWIQFMRRRDSFCSDHSDLASLDQIRGIDSDSENQGNGAQEASSTHNPGPVLTNDSLKLVRPAGARLVAMANNGWIMGNIDPQHDFAGPSSSVYIRREVIVWGDCVKLRYGTSPDGDSKWLWEHMRDYTRATARLFDGVRVDNAHNTPLHVGQWLLDDARSINPSLIVLAELFTSSAQADTKFVQAFGISTMVRESLRAGNPRELASVVYNQGGDPVGTLDRVKHPFNHPHAILMDMTHDNSTPSELRTPADALSNMAVVSMAVCAIGSTRGYDEMLLENPDVVSESRRYTTDEHHVTLLEVRSLVNKLHQELAPHYIERHVHHDDPLISITRSSAESGDSVLMVCRTAFPGHGTAPGLPDVLVPRGKVVPLFWARLVWNEAVARRQGANVLAGPSAPYSLELNQNDMGPASLVQRDTETFLRFQPEAFPPGSVACFRVVEENPVAPLAGLGWVAKASLYHEPWQEMADALTHLDLVDLNVLLYRCHEEDSEFYCGRHGAYVVPNYGALCYCGVYGVEGVLSLIRKDSDMGHPLLENIRQGSWLMDYLADRLSSFPKLHLVQQAIRRCFDFIKRQPSFLRPRLFDRAIRKLWNLAQNAAVAQMSQFVQSQGEGSFVQALAMTSLQVYGFAAAREEDNIAPTSRANGANPPLLLVPCKISMAAGLPHFSSGFMRSWGRDTFIALPGLLLVTGRLPDARHLLLEFAAVVWRGLVPNLHDHGVNPRYNARDATWFWLFALQQYCTRVGSVSILTERVIRCRGNPAPLSEIVQEILASHAQGISFREERAGREIDAHMTDEGFNVAAWVDESTGFVGGGNSHNCGTWMDKMGESEKAKTKGVPATPRDGSAIEIVALAAATVRWLAALHDNSDFAHGGVVMRSGTPITYQDWYNRIKANFHRCFWVPESPAQDAQHVIRQDIVNQRGIYKDTLWCSSRWGDYQFRPNQCIAMVAAPQLFEPACTSKALDKVQHQLLGKLGTKTLDASDLAFRPQYDPSADTDDMATSKGFNYHQGPEWLWPTAFFLRARLQFPSESQEATRKFVWSVLSRHKEALISSPWGGLPELTQAGGDPCFASCPTQAWSSGCMLEVMEDVLN